MNSPSSASSERLAGSVPPHDPVEDDADPGEKKQGWQKNATRFLNKCALERYLAASGPTSRARL